MPDTKELVTNTKPLDFLECGGAGLVMLLLASLSSTHLIVLPMVV